MQNQTQTFLWWQDGIIYQVYPRSFQDSNEDGIGDLKGIRSRLDYLQELGITSIWISPIYSSPMADFGYDISNYTDIHPLFGNLSDFDQLLTEIHNRGMKLILDFVPNHTSDQHPWFLESRSSRNNPKRDWYIWKDSSSEESLPNNWLAAFGGPAWEWDPTTGQFYYHAFLKEQPDLNWRNPEVQEAMLNAMRFWLDRGVDGFRVDVMWHMIKDKEFRDNPPNPNYLEYMATVDQLLQVYSTDQPEVHGVIRRMRDLLDSYHERMMIGEIYLPVNKLVTYYGEDGKGAHLPFNFQLINIPWNAKTISTAVNEYEGALPQGAWPNWVIGNHDNTRISSRIGAEQARIAGMLLLTLRGTPTIYYGEELGMKDVPIPFSEIQDPQGRNMPDKNLSRDPARTPMPWDSTTYAGFSTSKPWLPMGNRTAQVNVHVQEQDPESMLAFYKKIIQLRQSEPALKTGTFTPVSSDHQLMAFIRSDTQHHAFLIILNFTHRPAYFRQFKNSLSGTVVLSTDSKNEGKYVEGTIILDGDEGIIIRLD